MIQLIVLLPLLAAAIAGLGNKALGKLPAKIVTTGALFASCAMSWPILAIESLPKGALPSKACSTMPSRRSPSTRLRRTRPVSSTWRSAR